VIDLCPNTPIGSVVDSHGCSIEQLVPCAGPLGGGAWKNHGQYVSAIAIAANQLLSLGLITPYGKDAIVSAAARSNCAK
jgi:hypothetical protein